MAKIAVAPLAGARIEMVYEKCGEDRGAYVAPLAGARIEMMQTVSIRRQHWSLPSRERGLKSKDKQVCSGHQRVAPLAGARIEIFRLHPLSLLS